MSRQAHTKESHDGPFGNKRRRTTLYAALRKHLGEVLHRLAGQRESRIEEGHLMPDHVHMPISVRPKQAVSQVAGFITGKSAIHAARVYGERKRNLVRQYFWARGDFVTTVGRDEDAIREHIRHQDEADAKLDQMNLWKRFHATHREAHNLGAAVATPFSRCEPDMGCDLEVQVLSELDRSDRSEPQGVRP